MPNARGKPREIMRNIKEAIELYVETLSDDEKKGLLGKEWN